MHVMDCEALDTSQVYIIYRTIFAPLTRGRDVILATAPKSSYQQGMRASAYAQK